MIDKFTRDTRSANYWINLHEDDGKKRKYIPQLYLKSREWDPPHASPEVEAALSNFARRLRQEHRKYNYRWSKPNITIQQHHLLNYLKDHPTLIIIPSDKNLGPVIIERRVYIQRCLNDFLAKPTQYERLPNGREIGALRKIDYAYDRFQGSTYEGTIDEAIQDFFSRGKEYYGDKIARFRATPKVHKTPWALRPVIAKCGTTVECLSKWLDYELQKLKHFIPSYIKDSRDYHRKITSRIWPAGTRIIVADASAMYDNITIEHGIQSIESWLEFLRGQLPADFPPSDVILDALNVVMRNNIAQFGDCFFKQLCGTAMGTSVAVIYAGLYYGWHEKVKLLPTYNESIQDLSRFVDDMCVMWLGSYSDFLNFKRDVDCYGQLRWTMEAPSNTAIFLDLEISISDNGVISTKTYQKPMNLYLYIPPHSAHMDGMMKGIVYGELKRYHWQCSKREDYVEMVRKFFKRCVDRNWDPKPLKRIFLEANDKLSNPTSLHTPTQVAPQDATHGEAETERKRDRLFIRLPYHPCYIPRRTLREIYQQTCEDEIRQELGIERLTIAYSRAKNIGDAVTKSSLFQVSGEEVSTFLGE